MYKRYIRFQIIKKDSCEIFKSELGISVRVKDKFPLPNA